MGELEFLIRDLKTELHSELKSVAQAMAISDSNSNRTRARSPGKSEAQVLICEMKTEIDATLMEVLGFQSSVLSGFTSAGHFSGSLLLTFFFRFEPLQMKASA